MKENSTPSKVITLKYPFPASTGETLTALTMRRPQVLDVMAAFDTASDPAEITANLFASLCLMSNGDFDNLDGADFKQANDAYEELIAFSEVDGYTAGDAIPLPVPLVLRNGTEVPALKMRRPKVKDIKDAHKAAPTREMEQDCILFSALSGVEIEDMRKLDYAAFLKLKQIYGDFLA